MLGIFAGHWRRPEVKLVNRRTFLALPAGTVFQKYGDFGRQSVSIKHDTTPCSSDFWYVDLAEPWPENCQDSGQFFDMQEAFQNGDNFGPLDFECLARDGRFYKDQMFAVWNSNDVVRLINALQESLAATLAAEGGPK